MKGLAKITPPSPTGVFLRKRLFRLLDHDRSRSVIFITGPPGSGKTTLVASYVHTRKLACLWYQMDKGDVDPATFFYYMGLAAKKVAPRYKRPLPLFTPEYGPGVSTFARRYFEDLCSRLKRPYILVLDNYQEIPSESAMHEIIRTGLSVFPKNVSSVIISRSEPPAAFAALQAGNKLHAIGWNDLKLTPEESKGIVKLQDTGRPLTNHYEWLHEKADGWAAGLVLLSRAARSQKIDSQAIESFAPDKVFDYFASELFDRLSNPLQEFLLKTAFVPKITPKLAEDLTGNTAAGRILSDLNKGNYFTEKRAQPEVIYQYHPLFREFLLTHAKGRFSSGELSDLWLDAAKLLEASGQIEDAVDLFMKGKAWKELMGLISANALKLFTQGRNKLLEKWITALPDDLIKSDPWLNYWLGTCRLPSNPSESRAFYERAFELFVSQGAEAGALLAWSGAVQTFLYDFDDLRPLDRWIAWLDRHMEKAPSFPSPDIGLSVAAGMTAALTWRNPLHPDAHTWADRALSFSRVSSNIEARTRAYTNVAVHHIWMGDFDEGSLLISDMKKMIESQPVSPLRSIVMKHNEALLYNTSADYRQQALQMVSEGLEEAQRTGVYVLNSFLYTQGIVNSLNEGNPGRTEGFLSKLEKTLRGRSRGHASHYFYLSACHYLSIGKIPQAVFSAKKGLDLVQETGVLITEALIRLVLSHILHEAGDEEEASREFDAAKRAVMLTGSSYFAYLSSLTEAYFEDARNHGTAGLELLRKALTLGRKKGFTTLHYFWRPAVMSRLCEKALEAGIEVDYVGHLIRKLNLVPGQQSKEFDNWPWPVKIFTLGRFEVVKDEKPIIYPVRAPRAVLTLLKAIITFGSRGVNEDHLVDILWPEADGDTARQALKTNLYRLRRLIREERAIQVREGRVTLDQQYCWVDAYAFESLLERAERLLEGSQTGNELSTEGARLIDRALALYNGTFLGNEAHEAWMLGYQERLRSKFIRAVRKLGDYYEGSGRWARAVECYQRGLEVDELAEEFYQRLMVCYLSGGHRAEAIATYNRCQRVLQSVLGINPSPRTEEILKGVK